MRQTAAKDFASEGQQRSLVLALRLAQAAWFHEKSGVRPVLLAGLLLLPVVGSLADAYGMFDTRTEAAERSASRP